MSNGTIGEVYKHQIAAYYKQHAVCPKCGSGNLETTTMGCLGGYCEQDRNRARCVCDWRGIVHELIPEKNDGWRNIRDGLPTEDAAYFVFAPSADPERPYKHIAWYDPAYGWSLIPEVFIGAITHWMPLPPNPT